MWLKELTEGKYIRKYYDKKFAASPTIYCLGYIGRKYLKDNPGNSPEFKDIKLGLLDRVWREKTLSQEFREHCIFIADIFLSLGTLMKKTKGKLHFSTKTDLYGTEHLISPSPDAYFAIEEKSGNIKRYFLDVFDDIHPKRMRQRVWQYFNYYENNNWQDHTNKPFPEILLVCPNERLKKHLYYYIQNKLKRDELYLGFYLSVRQTIKSEGLRREMLQKVEGEPKI
jgi:hypothetical protein